MADLRTEDFHYFLPPDAIAHTPTARREDARLMVLDREGVAPPIGERMKQLPSLLRGDELLVFNDTRVVPARLFGKKDTGGAVEVLVLNAHAEHAEMLEVMARSSKRLRPGTSIHFGSWKLEVMEALGEGRYLLSRPSDVHRFLDEEGVLPLPPYIHRPDGPTDEDAVRYQTVLAKAAGAVAAPTAGLHFTPELLDAIQGKGCQIATVTLHVGPGTFLPVRTEKVSDHPMHTEVFEVPEKTVNQIRQARAAGRPVLAVGTTVVRALEGQVASDEEGTLKAGRGQTNIFITPGFEFQVVDQLLTNFHLPESTLLMLVSAFAEREYMLQSYRTAVTEGYRFYSYGDGMLIR